MENKTNEIEHLSHTAKHLYFKPFACLAKPKQILQKDTQKETDDNYGYPNDKLKEDEKKK